MKTRISALMVIISTCILTLCGCGETQFTKESLMKANPTLEGKPSEIYDQVSHLDEVVSKGTDFVNVIFHDFSHVYSNGEDVSFSMYKDSIGDDNWNVIIVFQGSEKQENPYPTEIYNAQATFSDGVLYLVTDGTTIFEYEK